MTAAAPPSPVELEEVDAFWRAANYLAVGQIYLLDNPLLREPLQPTHVKPRLLGHWGTTPGLTLIYAHLSRVIRQRDLDMMYVFGPGHGGPGVFATTWLDGSLGEVYPELTRDEAGMRELMRQFSLPGGLPSHMGPEVPGSIHEGGELGYALSHAYGAAFDNPDLVVACVVGDGEAETGPMAASWQSTAFLDPARDGAVLPILHLNGYKISNPTIAARKSETDLDHFFNGHGLVPRFVTGDDPDLVHGALARAFDDAITEIGRIQDRARSEKTPQPARWPVIVLNTPKGWTGPREIDGLPVEGTWRSHQVPIRDLREDPQRLADLESWLQSYRPEELFDERGGPLPPIIRWLPRDDSRLGANPHANGGRVARDLALPDPDDSAVAAAGPGEAEASPTEVLAGYLAGVFELNQDHQNFRLFGPDETASNKLDGVYEVTSKTWLSETRPVDEHLSSAGRVMEILSEHTLQGWLEGYLLTGRHGLFASYEAFVHIVDSMFNQHAKWLKVSGDLDWREAIPSLNYLLTSHCWRQDHNGFSHQDPGFIDHVANKKPEIIRTYLPPDANTLLCVVDRCLRSRGRVNVVVVGKHEEPVWLPIRNAAEHCAHGIGRWDWASSDDGDGPDVVLACAGDIPTTEVLAATELLRVHLPELRVRVVNVVDLMRLQPESEHPHGLSDAEFDRLFTTDRPVVFAYHGYPWLIHRLTYRRKNHPNLHVRGYREEGATTTPFDMRMLNDLDRFHLVMDVIDRVPGLEDRAAEVRRLMVEKRAEARAWTREYGDDIPEVRDWTWPPR